MNKFIMFSISTMAAQLVVAADQLPNINVPDAWRICTADSDCIIAGDACRSCGNHYIINKKYAEDFLKLDLDLRIKTKQIRTCEACSTDQIKISCDAGICRNSQIGN